MNVPTSASRFDTDFLLAAEETMTTRTDIGIAGPFYVPFAESSDPGYDFGDYYYTVAFRSVKLAFRGKFWDKVRNVAITSSASVNLPTFPEPVTSLQRIQPMRKNLIVSVPLGTQLISTTPATMTTLRIGAEFVVDRSNKMLDLIGLAESDALMAPLTINPADAALLKTVSAVVKGIIDAFSDQGTGPDSIFRFEKDFDLSAGELRSGHYIWLGTTSKDFPLPASPPTSAELSVTDSDVTCMRGGRDIIADLSRVVVTVRKVRLRTKTSGHGAWKDVLTTIEGIAARIENRPGVSQDERNRAWEECVERIATAAELFDKDPSFTPNEKKSILAAATSEAKTKIAPNVTPKLVPEPAGSLLAFNGAALQSVDEFAGMYEQLLKDTTVERALAGLPRS